MYKGETTEWLLDHRVFSLNANYRPPATNLTALAVGRFTGAESMLARLKSSILMV